MRKILIKLLYNYVKNISFGQYGSNLRIYCLKKLGVTCDYSCFIGPNVTIVSPHDLKIGTNTNIHQGCYIDASGKVTIGKNVSVAHDVSIISFNHGYTNKKIIFQKQPLEYKEIIIEDNVWIGCKSVILAGTTILERTVVGALSLCNKKYTGNEILAGIPAKSIKSI